MSDQKRKYDSTVARIAGNIASGMLGNPMVVLTEVNGRRAAIAKECVLLARTIVAEVERTEPKVEGR